jgi:hypothetical protein
MIVRLSRVPLWPLIALLMAIESLAGCASEANPTGEAVVAFTLDPHARYVVGVAIGLPTQLVAQTSSVLYLKSDHGRTSAWKKGRVSTEGPNAAITYVPMHRGERGPDVNDSVAAYYFTAHDDKLDLLPLTYVMPAQASPPPIANPNFHFWTSELYPSPVSWPISALPRTSFDVKVLGNYAGVRLSVATTPVQQPNAIATPVAGSAPAVSITQSVALRGERVLARIRPFQPCTVRSGRVIVADGIELLANGEQPVLFCVGDAAFSGSASLGGQRVIVKVVAGKIGSWNSLDFNIAPLKRAPGAEPFTMAIITQVDAVRSPYDWVTMDVASVASAP